jgi:hypothetical protein
MYLHRAGSAITGPIGKENMLLSLSSGRGKTFTIGLHNFATMRRGTVDLALDLHGFMSIFGTRSAQLHVDFGCSSQRFRKGSSRAGTSSPIATPAAPRQRSGQELNIWLTGSRNSGKCWGCSAPAEPGRPACDDCCPGKKTDLLYMPCSAAP